MAWLARMRHAVWLRQGFTAVRSSVVRADSNVPYASFLACKLHQPPPHPAPKSHLEPAQGARKGGGKPPASARKRARITRTFTTEDGETLSVGEDYYIMLDNFDPDEHEEEGDEGCEVCRKSQLLSGMLECGQCLRGFHLRCLKPPLKKVPEGEWLCPQVRLERW